jgi:hypothetical protein
MGYVIILFPILIGCRSLQLLGLRLSQAGENMSDFGKSDSRVQRIPIR